MVKLRPRNGRPHISSMRKLFLTTLLVLACFSFAASILLSALLIDGIHFSERLTALVLVGDFLALVPSIFIMRKLQDAYTQREIRTHAWEIALRGAPPWVTKAVKALGWCIMATFVLLLLLPKPRQDKPSVPSLLPLYFSFLSAYSAAILYSALHIDPNQPKCPNGHAVNSLQKFCPECGAPTAQPATNP